jgi:hypothetical protein
MDIISLLEDYCGISEQEAIEKASDFVKDQSTYLAFDISSLLPNVELIAEYKLDAVGYHNREGNAEGISVYKYKDKYLVYNFSVEGDEDEGFQDIPNDDDYTEESDNVSSKRPSIQFYENHFTFYDNIDPVFLLDEYQYSKDSLKFVRDLFLYFSTKKELIKYIMELE